MSTVSSVTDSYYGVRLGSEIFRYFEEISISILETKVEVVPDTAARLVQLAVTRTMVFHQPVCVSATIQSLPYFQTSLVRSSFKALGGKVL